MQILNRDSINLLIDTMINTTIDKNPRGKFNLILKQILKSEDVRIARNTLLLWLDTMNIFSVDFQKNEFKKIKPIWVLCAIEHQYILLGALTIKEINLLDYKKIKYNKNSISYKNFQFELPNTYYSVDINEIRTLGFDILEFPLFNNIENCNSINDITNNLKQGTLLTNTIENLTSISFEINDKLENVYIENQDEIYLFNWRKRDFDNLKCNLKSELEDSEGTKLIKIIKKKGDFSSKHIEIYTLLLERNGENEHWKYIYFDSSKTDERWARYIYINRLSHYDLYSDLKRVGISNAQKLINNIIKIKKNDIIELDDNFDINDSNHIVKISSLMIKQLIQYDVRKGILAFPITMPLPKEIMKQLYSCSGLLPTVFKNKFSINPNYPIKLLVAGKLSEDGYEVNYPDENYFMEEDFFLFGSVPKEVADIIFDKLKIEPYKRTFFEKN